MNRAQRREFIKNYIKALKEDLQKIADVVDGDGITIRAALAHLADIRTASPDVKRVLRQMKKSAALFETNCWRRSNYV